MTKFQVVFCGEKAIGFQEQGETYQTILFSKHGDDWLYNDPLLK